MFRRINLPVLRMRKPAIKKNLFNSDLFNFENLFSGFSEGNLEDFLDNFWEGKKDTSFSVDVRSDEKAFYVIADLPGMNHDSIDVSVKGKELFIKGDRKNAKNTDDSDIYLLREREQGKVEKTVTFDREIDVEKVTANYENGVLSITLPVVEQTKPKKIAINKSVRM